MPDISMLELRAKLSWVLQKVEEGETFTITRFGSTVATLSPASREVTPDITKPVKERK